MNNRWWSACLVLLITAALVPALAAAELPFEAGAAKVDVTPDYPILLSGYAARGDKEVARTIQPLFARAFAFNRPGEKPLVLVSVDNCGIPATVSEAVSQELSAKFDLPRSHLAVCSTHTHYAPMLSGVLPNLFTKEIPAEKQATVDRYTRELTAAIVKAASQAIESGRPAKLSYAIGEVGFAANRRTSGGPTDHQLPVLTVRDADDEMIAVVAGYACHCTTIGSTPAFIGDWAGYASEYLEREYPGSVALITIGCGGDQNPNPRGKLEFSQQYGQMIRDEVVQLVRAGMPEIVGQTEATFANVPLPFSPLPTLEQWQEMAKSDGINGFYAGNFVRRIENGETIADHLPYPIQCWTIGDDLAFVFLGGEVTVDYSLQLKEKAPEGKLWVAAYANDVRSYIPSKRVLQEGGYEGGGSRVWYDQPQVFAEPVEATILEEVERQLPAGFQK